LGLQVTFWGIECNPERAQKRTEKGTSLPGIKGRKGGHGVNWGEFWKGKKKVRRDRTLKEGRQTEQEGSS